jgi:hypothetical protein
LGRSHGCTYLPVVTEGQFNSSVPSRQSITPLQRSPMVHTKSLTHKIPEVQAAAEKDVSTSDHNNYVHTQPAHDMTSMQYHLVFVRSMLAAALLHLPPLSLPLFPCPTYSFPPPPLLLLALMDSPTSPLCSTHPYLSIVAN